MLRNKDFPKTLCSISLFSVQLAIIKYLLLLLFATISKRGLNDFLSASSGGDLQLDHGFYLAINLVVARNGGNGKLILQPLLRRTKNTMTFFGGSDQHH